MEVVERKQGMRRSYRETDQRDGKRVKKAQEAREEGGGGYAAHQITHLPPVAHDSKQGGKGDKKGSTYAHAGANTRAQPAGLRL